MSYLKTLTEAKELLFEREPFTTGTLSAKYLNNGHYVVFSYNELIAEDDREGYQWLTQTKFSQTTSKHLNIIKRAWGVN